MSVYLAFNPPGGIGTPNAGGCSVNVVGATPEENAAQVYNWTNIVLGTPNVVLLPGQKITLSGNVAFTCTNPAAVNGLNWEVKALADIHGEDFGSCDTIGEIFNGVCNVAVNEDDDNDANNSKVTPLPKVVAL
jgi:hypothetical protein